MILLLGGTSDAREAAAELRRAGYEVLVSTASAYGARLAEPSGAEVRGGPLDEQELERLVLDAAAVVDATHPFAERISAAAAAACAKLGRPYLRLERPAGDLPSGVALAADAVEAADLAAELARDRGGAILLTAGSKTVEVYARAAQAAGVRLIARVLPLPESLAACSGAGLEPRDVIAMQGPATAELDAALLRHLGAVVLVTKDSGSVGGLDEKLQAAELAGATAVVVQRPAEPRGGTDAGKAGADAASSSTSPATAPSAGDVLSWLERQPGIGPGAQSGIAAAPPRRRGLLQVYTGDGKGKTTAAVGQTLRARGAGLTVVFVQFVKGGRESSELGPLRAAGITVVRPAVERSGLLRGAVTTEDRAAAAAAWAAARAALSDATCDVVVLDELHAALRHGLVELDEVLTALAARPPHQEVVTTGRGAPDGLIAAAALVTEMTAVRHPYPDVPARRGVEL